MNIVIFSLRVIIPMTGFNLENFDMLLGIFIGSLSFSLKSFIGNFIAYMYVLYDDMISEGDNIMDEYKDEWEVVYIKSQYLYLVNKKDDNKKLYFPLDGLLSGRTIISKKCLKFPS